MILPTIRASVSRSDANRLVDLLSGGDRDLSEAVRRRLDEDGLDSLLDDPRTLNALLASPRVRVRPEVVFYVLVRQALLEGGIESRSIADYVASVVTRFGQAGRAFRVSESDPQEYRYLVDMVSEAASAKKSRKFLLRLHLGDYSLWVSGLFPDWVESRVRRRGAPPLSYYEEMGMTGYSLAAGSHEAEKMGLDEILQSVSDHFAGVRVALNRISDRHFWPHAGDPVSRVLREVARGA
jgi:hypothetical protein